MVTREKGESGDEAYRISARLVHIAITSIVGAIISFGGYMTVWAISDAQWKAKVDERMTNFMLRLSDLEVAHVPGVHPIAKERIEQVERRVRDLETRERR